MSDAMPVRSGGFRPGVRVRVIGGTFVGCEGQIMGTDEARERRMPVHEPRFAEYVHNVMLLIFGHDIPVQLQSDQIDYA